MRTLTYVLLVCLLAGCRFSAFDDIEDDAPVVALKPGSYATGFFGNVMAAYVGQTMVGTPIARVVSSAGVGSEQVVLNFWDGEGLGTLRGVTGRCNELDGPDPDCEAGVGGALVGISEWRGNRDCYLTTALDPVPGDTNPEGEGTMRVMCEAERSSFRILPVEGVALGTDAAALPAANPVGVAIISAPEAPGGGQLYRLENEAASPMAIANPVDLTLAADARLGTGLAVHALTSLAGLEQPLLVAAGAPGEGRVVVFALGTAGGVTELRTLACIDDVATRAPAVQMGGDVAIGNVDGDPALEVIVGDPVGNLVRVVDIDPAGVSVGCGAGAADDPPSITVVCPAGATGTADVNCLEFGTAIATGDVNVDGFDDLLIGAPGSTVGADPMNVTATGAFYVVPGSATGPDGASARVLIPSAVGSEERLGQSVDVIRSQLGEPGERDEPVVSAPHRAKNRIFAFLCTGLPGDEGIEGDRCLR